MPPLEAGTRLPRPSSQTQHSTRVLGVNLRIAADRVDLWRASLPTLPALQALLSPDELDRAARFHFEKDSRHFIAARGCEQKPLHPQREFPTLPQA